MMLGMSAQLLESPGMSQKLDQDKMRERRKLLGLSQTEAAKLAGLGAGAAHWSDIEKGKRANVTVDTLGRIAAALQCDARDLLTDPDHAVKRVRKPRGES